VLWKCGAVSVPVRVGIVCSLRDAEDVGTTAAILIVMQFARKRC
jgi:hypothetical protein